MIKDRHFKKTYTINIDIDLDSCNWDPEWACEDLECGGDLTDLSIQIREDLEDEIAKIRGEE